MVKAEKDESSFIFVSSDMISNRVTDSELSRNTDIETNERLRAEDEWMTSGDEWDEWWLLMPHDEDLFVCTLTESCARWRESGEFVHPKCGLHPSKSLHDVITASVSF